MSDTSDQRVGTLLGMHPEAVAHARNEYNEGQLGTIIRAVIADRLNQPFEEQQRKLRRVKPEDLKTIQGNLDGIETALNIASQPLT